MADKGKGKDKGKAKSAPPKAKKSGLRPHEQRDVIKKLEGPKTS